MPPFASREKAGEGGGEGKGRGQGEGKGGRGGVKGEDGGRGMKRERSEGKRGERREGERRGRGEEGPPQYLLWIGTHGVSSVTLDSSLQSPCKPNSGSQMTDCEMAINWRVAVVASVKD
jgi:hypothetical protein